MHKRDIKIEHAAYNRKQKQPKYNTVARKKQATYARSHQVDGLVDSSQGRDIDSLTTDDTGGTDTGRIFTGTGVHDGGDEHLDRVVAGDEVDQFEGLLDDVDGLPEERFWSKCVSNE